MTEVKTTAGSGDAEPADIKKIAAALRTEDDNKAKKDAREAVKAMQGTWEHLPVSLRAAIRADVARLVAAGKGKAEVIAAGYSEITAERALRDLGHRG